MLSITSNAKFNFMQYRNIALAVSSLLLVISLASLATRWLELGVDFTGGTLIEIGYPEATNLTEVRKKLATIGYGDAEVQHFGSAKDVLVRIPPLEGSSQEAVSNQVFDHLRSEGSELRRVEFVGPKIGKELREDGGLAMLYALLGILIYVGFRFELRFAIGSIIALLHDVILTIGFFSLFAIEFDLTVVAAVLAVIGYSLNDTIVVYDRIRESFQLTNKRAQTEDIINQAINKTLSRTLITSLTTMLVLLALLVFGGEIIKGFAIALLVGIVVGTYSSIYIASSSVIMLGIKREHMIPAKKEGADLGGDL